MIAARHLPGLAVLLALACVPTILHSYMGATLEDGRTAAAVPARLNGLDGHPTDRSAAWVLDKYGATDFIERQYGPDTTLFVARSYDAKRIYHHPEHGVARGDGYERATLTRLPARPEVPLFVLKGSQDRLSVYTLLYQDEFVSDPIRFQLRNAFTSLIRPRMPMTLFFVRGRGEQTRAAGMSSAETLLLAAVDGFFAQRSSSAQ